MLVAARFPHVPQFLIIQLWRRTCDGATDLRHVRLLAAVSRGDASYFLPSRYITDGALSAVRPAWGRLRQQRASSRQQRAASTNVACAATSEADAARCSQAT